MHKRLLNEALLELTIRPQGPILIKAGDTGADPTRPDMEFVRTWYNGQRVVYLPGPSLKGVLRSHCERIVRTVNAAACCYPVSKGNEQESCVTRHGLKQEDTSEHVHKHSCFVCQMFGNTVLAGRVRTADAYPIGEVHTEERNGVAIDRVFGSVAVGPFQMEVVTAGEFKTKLSVSNFTIAQLGLLALALRDLKLGRVAIGFGKSRGLGQVEVSFDRLVLRYTRQPAAADRLAGAARLLAQDTDTEAKEADRYGYLFATGRAFGYTSVGQDVSTQLPNGLALTPDDWGEWQLDVPGNQIEEVWKKCIPAWKDAIRLEGEA